MSFHHFTPPREEDFDSDEDYQDALECWERAEDDWVDEYIERMRDNED